MPGLRGGHGSHPVEVLVDRGFSPDTQPRRGEALEQGFSYIAPPLGSPKSWGRFSPVLLAPRAPGRGLAVGLRGEAGRKEHLELCQRGTRRPRGSADMLQPHQGSIPSGHSYGVHASRDHSGLLLLRLQGGVSGREAHDQTRQTLRLLTPAQWAVPTPSDAAPPWVLPLPAGLLHTGCRPGRRQGGPVRGSLPQGAYETRAVWKPTCSAWAGPRSAWNRCDLPADAQGAW